MTIIKDPKIVELEKLVVGMAHMISEDLDIQDIEVMCRREGFLYDHIQVGFKTFVWAEKLGQQKVRLSAGWPASWWDHFKRDVLRGMLGLKVEWDMETAEKTVEFATLYPNWKPNVPNQNHVVKVIQEDITLAPWREE